MLELLDLTSVRRFLGRQRRRLQVLRTPFRLRGSLPSSKAAERIDVGALYAEIYLLEVPAASGLGLSVYVGQAELLRFDCLGDIGHYHVNLRQAMFASAGEVVRHSFHSRTIVDQFDEALGLLWRDFFNAQRCNWSPAVRRAQVSKAQLDELIKRLRATHEATYRHLCSAPSVPSPSQSTS